MNPNLTNSFVRVKYYLTINDKFVEATRVFIIILLLRFNVKIDAYGYCTYDALMSFKSLFIIITLIEKETD